MEWAELVRSYVEGWREQLSKVLAALHDSSATAPARPDDRTAETLWRLGHRLAGSGATYGFAELSSVGQRLQALAQRAVQERRALTPQERLEAKQLLEQALSHLERHRSGGVTSVAHPGSAGFERGDSLTVQPVPRLPGDRALKVAYLDDDAFMREWFKRALPPPAELRLCATPEELRACLRDFAPDAILVDLVLGSVSGYDVCAELKRDPALARVPLFLVSASSGFTDRVRAIQSGAETVLPKPFDPTDLVQRIRRIQEMSPQQPPAWKVAAVDDSEDVLRAVAHHLNQAGLVVETTTRPLETLELVRRFQPDLLLLDMDMPDADGADVCRAIRQEPGFAMLPIIFLTARSDDEAKLRGLRAGADDYITKPFSPVELVARVTARLERLHLLRSMTLRDGLTGVFNHAYFQEQLRKELATAKRYRRSLAVCIIDVDHFKQVNDRHGHMTGDEVLRVLAHLLTGQLRRSDTVARYGGEEFALLLPEAPKADAVKVVDYLRRQFEARRFVRPDPDGTFQVTFSAGVAAFPEDGEDAEELLRKADAALYAAKQAGRNQVQGA